MGQKLHRCIGTGIATLLTAWTVVPASSADDVRVDEIRVNQGRIEHRIQALSEFGRNPEGGVSRVAYSDADIQGRAYVKTLMEQAGLTVRVDAGGNIIGRRAGAEPTLPPIMFGSHIDSVPGGGNYDGHLGSIAAIEVAQTLADHGIAARHPLEVIIFADEEGGLVGSRALAGRLSAKALETVSHSGFTIREGIRRIGGDPDALGDPLVGPGVLAAFLELHIEQGAILHEEGIDIGVVEGIVGIRWWDVTIDGMANHAGTTPMNRRRDALVAGARLVLAVNEAATHFDGAQVATVGRIGAGPGAPNVIPGTVEMSLEIRDLSEARMAEVFARISAKARQIGDATGTEIRFAEVPLDAKPAPTDPRLRDIIAGAADKLGLSAKRMPSGAGHDAQEMVRIAPTGMIFVPSVDGISHSPAEFTSAADMANGANTLLHAVLEIDRSW